ncbi:MAG: Unknown protein [uncultured Sulfurovum sp.]|uniref:Uncharacterized protein n=1 Tax=uncultured Sulfurovum sp. TaxID=269237 RepID=A0A6S6T0W9_9BACT|nr:MAG: Unknown protein [uncultured Sulfurovum sp.]
MYKKTFVFTALIIFNTFLGAMDLNQTISIINEATKVTTPLQEQLEVILTEKSMPKTEEEIFENNLSTEPIITEILTVTEIVVDEREITDDNITIEPIIETIVTLSESNESILIPHNELQEENISSPSIEALPLLSNLEINQSKELNVSIKTNITHYEQKVDLNESTCENQSNVMNVNDANNSLNTKNTCADAEGSSIKGLLLFKTRIKPYCDISGEKFAKQYMQEDWDDIYHDKEFKMEVIKTCPNMKTRYKDIWTPHLYQFSLEYASDSDAIPEC